MTNSNNLHFALPQIGSTQMNRDDQGALLVNQATAAIVCSYLEHVTQIHINLGLNSTSAFAISPSELPALINDIQDALKNF